MSRFEQTDYRDNVAPGGHHLSAITGADFASDYRNLTNEQAKSSRTASKQMEQSGLIGNVQIDHHPSGILTWVKPLSDVVVGFDHWVQAQSNKLKQNSMPHLTSTKEAAFGRTANSSLPDHVAAPLSAGFAFAKTIDQQGQHLTPRAIVDDNLSLAAGALDTAKATTDYFGKKIQDHELGTIPDDAGKQFDRVGKRLGDNFSAFAHSSAGHNGEVGGQVCAGVAFFCIAKHTAISEKECAVQLGLARRELAALTDEQLATKGLVRIEPVGKRLPSNWKFAGRVLHFEGDLGRKYPAGVPFDEKGFPDFSKYVRILDDGRRCEITVPKSNDRAVDKRIANVLFGFAKTPTGFAWHHVPDGPLQLVPFDLHAAASHTGGFAKNNR